MNIRLILRRFSAGLKALLVCAAIMVAAQTAGAQDRKGPRMTYVYNGPPVSFQQLYDNPDDRVLNLNYARQQSARGDLLGASAALERLLFSEPNWHSARLFYAAVLYRLDDKKAALRELELLSGSDMTEEQRSIYEDYGFAFQYTPSQTASANLTEEQIAYSRRDPDAGDGQNAGVAPVSPPSSTHAKSETLFQGRIAAGVRADSNAGNALTDVTAGLTDEDDNAVFLVGGAQGQIPITEGGLHIFGGLNGQTRRHEEFSRADFDTIGAHAGVFKDIGKLRLSAQLDADKVYIAGSGYLTQTGPRLTVSTQTNSDMRASVSVGHYDQEYSNLTPSGNEALASGDKTVILGRITKKLNAKLVIGGSFGAERKEARFNTLSYNAVRMGAHFTAGEADGWQLRGKLSRRELLFKDGGADTERINARLGVSAPISLIAKNDALPNVRAEAAINYNSRDTDLPGADFDNTGAELRLIWDF